LALDSVFRYIGCIVKYVNEKGIGIRTNVYSLSHSVGSYIQTTKTINFNKWT